MDRTLLRDFWHCGDDQIIEFAIMRARLNRREKEAISLILDDCRTQEQAAEIMEISTRHFQNIWYSAVDKLLNIAWVRAYAKDLRRAKDDSKHSWN